LILMFGGHDMRNRGNILLGAGIAAVATAAGVLVAGRKAFERDVSREVAALLAGSRGASPAAIEETDLTGLPDPVARWLRFAGVVGTRQPAVVRLSQEGTFRQAPDAAWRPFIARQVYTTDPPGFVWAADIRVAPFVSVKVLDRYIAGQGGTDPSLLGLVSLGSARGPEIDAGSLQRYLNETMWFPTAALSPNITWEAIDANSARARIRDGELSVSAVFVVDDEGRLVTMTADRYRTAGDAFILTPWETTIRGYGQFNGLDLPSAGEGVWKLDSGVFAYIELRVTAIAYDPPPA
jgi:hypothetical protein